MAPAGSVLFQLPLHGGRQKREARPSAASATPTLERTAATMVRAAKEADVLLDIVAYSMTMADTDARHLRHKNREMFDAAVATSMREEETTSAATHLTSEQARHVHLMAARSRSTSGTSSGDPYAVFGQLYRPGADEKGKDKAPE